MRHGFWEDDREWSLAEDEVKLSEGERPSIKCPSCGRIYRGGRCLGCNYEPNKKERKSQGLEFDGTELKQITKRDRKPSKQTHEQIMVGALIAAGRTGKTMSQAIWIAQSKAKSLGVTDFKVPQRIEKYNMILPSFTSRDSRKRVCDLFPWTAGRKA